MCAYWYTRMYIQLSFLSSSVFLSSNVNGVRACGRPMICEYEQSVCMLCSSYPASRRDVYSGNAFVCLLRAHLFFLLQYRHGHSGVSRMSLNGRKERLLCVCDEHTQQAVCAP